MVRPRRWSTGPTTASWLRSNGLPTGSQSGPDPGNRAPGPRTHTGWLYLGVFLNLGPFGLQERQQGLQGSAARLLVWKKQEA